MKTFKSPDNTLHCIDPDFAHLLPAGCVEITEAEADAIRAAAMPAPDPVAALKTQIAQIEATITPRRLREAVLGVDNGWLANINAQIAALRAQLAAP